MRRSRAEAAVTRSRAVEVAARLFRGKGVDAVGLKDVMAALGMTHGGFYRHFASKDALVAEALEAAGEGSAAAIGRIAAAAGPDRTLAAVVDEYLSAEHVASPDRGCPVAALVTDVRRQSAPARRAFTRAILATTRLLEAALPATGRRRARALFAYAALVGGVAMARAVDDRDLAAEILASVREGLLGG